MSEETSLPSTAIAIVGLSLRVAGADDASSFWRLVRNGTEAITRFGRGRLVAAGVPAVLAGDPRFVAARGVLADIDKFDARLFGMSDREAALTDPQHRLFLECCWQALESGGYAPGEGGQVGVYAGSSYSGHLHGQALAAIDGHDVADLYQVLIGNDKDFLATRVADKLHLEGPALAIQTACSSSLVAVHVACQGLLSGECDVALAGGVSLRLPQVGGFLHQEGMILSADGHCRAYDARAGGTVSGDGVGVVVLKRLGDALEAGDVIRAVIRGSAVNNDGGRKVGFTAPSVAGQSRVIAEALAVAGVEAGSIGYVEGHGTGTRLGDPLEVAALNEAYRGSGERIALGSVKPNIGHLDTAAGVVGLIKVVLGLEQGEIPPSLHFERPNPEINFAGGPFYVPQQVEAWPEREGTRRGGVSSFGIGGTNAHVVLEAAPARTAPRPAARQWQVVPVSGRTAEGLAQQCEQLATAIGKTNLADAAYTLSVGRRAFRHRRAVVARDAAEAARALATPATGLEAETHEVALLFPGQGAQRVGMGGALYREGGVYAEAVRESAGPLSAALGQDVLKLVLSGDEAALGTTAGGQAALFAVSYGLARQWEAWGVKGSVLLGHSLGEYVAATMAGVFTVADAAKLVAARGRLMERAKGGAMLAVALDEARVRDLCRNGIDLAAVNGEQQCVLSGDAAAIAAIEVRLTGQGHWVRRLGVNYGFHSHLLDPVLEEFETLVRSVKLNAPQRRLVSSVTGTWMSDAEATDAGYWSRQMRAPVRFWEGLRTIAGSERVLCVEAGPGQTLSGLARGAGLAAQASWPTGKDEEESLSRALAGLWEKGVEVDWPAVHGPGRRRIELPGIVFERQRHWLEAKATAAAPTPPVDDTPHLYAPVWRRWFSTPGELPLGPYLVVQGGPAGRAVSAALRAAGRDVTEVEAGEDYGRVLQGLREKPREIVHTLAVDAKDEDLLEQGFHAAHALVRALIGAGATGMLTVVSRNACAVTGLERVKPEAATLRGLIQVVPQEHPDLRCRGIDVCPREGETATQLAATIVSDLGLSQDQPLVARRGRQLWVPDRQALPDTPASSLLRHGGTYLITGGLGAIGLTIAKHLAQKYNANIALIARKQVPSDRLQAIEQAAGGLLVGAADVADERAMRAFVSTVEAKFGPLNGVIHAAGVIGQAARLPFATASREDVASLMHAKLSGTRVLDRVLAGRPLDFVCLMSSLAVELGGAGLGPYAAANCALDAFAGDRSATPWMTINWDGWRFDAGGLGIAPDGGIAAWEAALASRTSQVAVVLGDFAARLARWQKPRPVVAEKSSAATPTLKLGSHTEIAVARVWEAVLGRADLGPADDFFDLGGDSLRAAQVLNRLRSDLGVEIPMRLMFEAPSVAAFAGGIDRLLAVVIQPVASAGRRMEVEF